MSRKEVAGEGDGRACKREGKRCLFSFDFYLYLRFGLDLYFGLGSEWSSRGGVCLCEGDNKGEKCLVLVLAILRKWGLGMIWNQVGREEKENYEESLVGIRN